MSNEDEQQSQTRQYNLPLSVPVWGWLLYLLLLSWLTVMAGRELRDVIAIMFTAAFTFQFFWACALRGLWKQREQED